MSRAMRSMTRTTPNSVDDAACHPPLLDRLLHAPAALTITDLANALSLLPAAVRAELDRLARVGCQLTYDAHGAVRLEVASPAVWSDYLEWAGRGRWRINHYRRTTSTQDVARTLSQHAARHDTGALVVIAQEQTAGRGRLGRSWHAPPGTAITFSRVIPRSADEKPHTCDHLTVVIGVAVARAVEAALKPDGHPVAISWPNDIMIDDRKLAGILVETFNTPVGARAAIVGVGINVGLVPDDLPQSDPQLGALRDHITSFAMLGRPLDRLRLLRQVFEAIDLALTQPLPDILAEWRRLDHTIGTRIEALAQGQPIAGEVIDLDAHAGLLLRTHDGTITHLPAATSTILRRL